MWFLDKGCLCLKESPAVEHFGSGKPNPTDDSSATQPSARNKHSGCHDTARNHTGTGAETKPHYQRYVLNLSEPLLNKLLSDKSVSDKLVQKAKAGISAEALPSKSPKSSSSSAGTTPKMEAPTRSTLYTNCYGQEVNGVVCFRHLSNYQQFLR